MIAVKIFAHRPGEVPWFNGPLLKRTLLFFVVCQKASYGQKSNKRGGVASFVGGCDKVRCHRHALAVWMFAPGAVSNQKVEFDTPWKIAPAVNTTSVRCFILRGKGWKLIWFAVEWTPRDCVVGLLPSLCVGCVWYFIAVDEVHIFSKFQWK